MKKKNDNVKKNTSNKQKKKQKIIDIPINDTGISDDDLIDLVNNLPGEELNEDTDKGIDIVNSHNEKVNEERKERIYEKQNEEIEEDNNVRHRIRPVLIAFILVIIIAIFYVVFEYGPIFGINIIKNDGISEDKKIDIITSEDDIYDMYNQELLVYSNNVVSTYNSYCQKTWSYDLAENFVPTIYTYNEYMVIANNSNGLIYMFENKKEMFSKKIDGIIQDVYIDEYGNIAVEYSTTGYKKIIGVYDRNGREKFNAYLSSTTIIDIKMIENCTKLLVAQADSNSFSIGVTLNIVDSTKENDNISELCRFDNNLLYDMNIQGQNAIVLLNNKISKVNLINGNVSDIKVFDDSQLLFVSIYDNYYTCCSKELNNQDKYIVTTTQYNGTNISTLEVENSPKSLYGRNLLNYFLYQNYLQVINKWGIEVKKIPIDILPKDIVIFNNEKSVGLIYTNKIYIVNL